MGIRADNHVPGHGEPFLRQQGMLDAHLSHLEIVGDIVLPGEFPDALAVLRGLDVLVGHEMIRHQSNLVLVEDAPGLELVHLLDCHRAGDIIAQHQVQIRLDQLAGFHLFQSGSGRQDFLRHCHSHIHNPSFP